MRAVLRIIETDNYLRDNVLPFIDLEHESIEWDQIFSFAFGSGHRAALVFAFGLWADQLRDGSDPFDAAFSLNPTLQRAVFQGLAIRWGLF